MGTGASGRGFSFLGGSAVPDAYMETASRMVSTTKARIGFISSLGSRLPIVVSNSRRHRSRYSSSGSPGSRPHHLTAYSHPVTITPGSSGKSNSVRDVRSLLGSAGGAAPPAGAASRLGPPPVGWDETGDGPSSRASLCMRSVAAMSPNCGPAGAAGAGAGSGAGAAAAGAGPGAAAGAGAGAGGLFEPRRRARYSSGGMALRRMAAQLGRPHLLPC